MMEKLYFSWVALMVKKKKPNKNLPVTVSFHFFNMRFMVEKASSLKSLPIESLRLPERNAVAGFQIVWLCNSFPNGARMSGPIWNGETTTAHTPIKF